MKSTFGVLQGFLPKGKERRGNCLLGRKSRGDVAGDGKQRALLQGKEGRGHCFRRRNARQELQVHDNLPGLGCLQGDFSCREDM